MIEYVIAENIDERILKRANLLMSEGKLIAFPTDTNWVVATSISNKKGVEALYKFKSEEKTKHFSLLTTCFKQAQEVAEISNQHYRLLRPFVPGPYTFIFSATKKACKMLKATKVDKEVGIRFSPSPVATALGISLEYPIISTNIRNEQIGVDSKDEIFSYLIEEKIGHQISMIIDPGEYQFLGSSSIINFTNNDIVIDRIGTSVESQRLLALIDNTLQF